MQFTTNNAYRKTKMTIDAINIIVALAEVTLLIAVFVLPGDNEFLLPVVFLLGAIANAGSSVKSFIKQERFKANMMIIASLLLLIVMLVSMIVIWG